MKGPCWRHGIGRGCRPLGLITKWESKEIFEWEGVCLVACVRHTLHLLRDCYVIFVSMSSVQYVCFNWLTEGLKNRIMLCHWTTDWLTSLMCLKAEAKKCTLIEIKEHFDDNVKLLEIVWLLILSDSCVAIIRDQRQGKLDGNSNSAIQWGEFLASLETHQWIQAQCDYHRQSIDSCTLSTHYPFMLFCKSLWWLKIYFIIWKFDFSLLLCLFTSASQILTIASPFSFSPEP